MASGATLPHARYRTCYGLLFALAALLLALQPQLGLALDPGHTHPCPPAGGQRVQLDVVVAQIRGNTARNLARHFLKTVRSTGSRRELGPADVFVERLPQPSGFLGFLQALEQENLAKLLAQPRLVTLSGNPASFLDGGEQAVPVPAGPGKVGVQFEEVGTRLNFLPIVLGNGRIHLEVEPEVSTIDPTGQRSTQRMHTTADLEAGQTLVVGGLIQKTVTASAQRIPVLEQIPFVRTAFSVKSAVADEAELVILVTPHLIDPTPGDGELAQRLRRLKRLQAEVEKLQREAHPAQESGPSQGGRP